MAPAKLTPAQARDRRAKRAAIVLVAVLGVALVIQGPKLLKMVHKSSPPVSASSVNVSQVSATAVSAGAVTATGSQALGATGIATTAGQLKNLSRFAVKDPFHAQNVPSTSATASTAPASTTPATPTATSTNAATTTTKTPPPATAVPAAATTTTPALPFEVTTPTAPPNAAVLVANGRREIVPIGADFPSDAPLFKLNALRKAAPAIRISVVGGTFIGGLKTIRLDLGKSLTFANESDGTRYVIKLVRLTTVASTSPPAAPAPPANPQAPAGAATTTTAGGS